MYNGTKWISLVTNIEGSLETRMNIRALAALSRDTASGEAERGGESIEDASFCAHNFDAVLEIFECCIRCLIQMYRRAT